MTEAELAQFPGLRHQARARLLAAQPATVLEALALPDVGRRTTRRLLALGLLTDPQGVQSRRMDAALPRGGGPPGAQRGGGTRGER